MIGATLQNRYYIEAEIGRGGMGVVYRAHDTVLDRPVAVKVLSSLSLGPQGKERLLSEARAAAKLNHPNIVSIYDAGEAEGAPFIVMELVEGQLLREVGLPRLPLAEALELTHQICAAIEHAHGQGIIHRDLKPENIVVTRHRVAKLMDFGVARAQGASRLTDEGMIVGTFAYIAPELVTGQETSPHSDLYALGVIMYELVAGRPPFTGETLMAVIAQHLHAPVVPPSTFNPDVPAALDTLIVRLLSKQPGDRPASATEVRETLDDLDQAEAGEAAPTEVSLLDRVVRGRLVGREREMTEAKEVWRRAVGGEGQVLLVSGEPGVGKTRFVRELIALAEVAHATTLVNECYAEGSAPYAPISQIVRAAFADPDVSLGLPRTVLADLITLQPELRARYPDAPSNPPLDPRSEQQRLFESVAALCNKLSLRAPVLLFVDDAHWADSNSLYLLRHLARRARQQRLLVVLSYREVELDQTRALNDVLADLNRERLAARIKLSRLTRDQTRDLLEAMLGEELPPDFVNGIYRETEGNPFFVEEVVKALIEEGKLYREAGRWRRPGMDEIQIPQSVRVAIQSRVAKLPQPAQEALLMAAVLGREFDFDVLQAASELDDDSLINALESAGRAQLLDELRPAASKGATFAFTHALIPSTLRESASGPRRQRLHRRAAMALEALRPEDYEALAYHYSQAGDQERALVHYLKAGERALGAYANQEAGNHFRAALLLVVDEADRARLLAGLGQALSQQSRFKECIDTWRDAIRLYQAVKDGENVARLYAQAARAAWSDGNPRLGLDLGREGLAAVAGQPESVAQATLLHEAGRAFFMNGFPDEAWPLCQRALDTAVRLGGLGVQAEALTTLAIFPSVAPEESVKWLRQAIELAESAGLIPTAFRARHNLGEILKVRLGDLRSARDHALRARQLARGMGTPFQELLSLANAIEMSLMLGDFDFAEQSLRDLRQLHHAASNPRSESLVGLNEALLLRYQGAWPEAIQRLHECEAVTRQQGNLQGLGDGLQALGELLFELGELDEAESRLAEAIDIGDRGLSVGGVRPRCVLAGVHAQRGEIEEARRVLAAARTRAGPQCTPYDEENLHLAEGRLAAAERFWPEAAAAFASAAAIEARMGKQWYRAQTLQELAAVCVAQAEVNRARELLREARGIFEELNVPRYAALAKDRLVALPRETG